MMFNLSVLLASRFWDIQLYVLYTSASLAAFFTSCIYYQQLQVMSDNQVPLALIVITSWTY